MKDQQFTLQEIQAMLALRRTSNMIEPHTLMQRDELYAQKKRELLKKISLLNEAITSIEEDEKSLTQAKPASSVTTGVPLRALGLLECPNCGHMFKLENADLDARYVYRGTLRCDCGKELQIIDGILETGNLYAGSYDSPDIKRELYTEVIGKFLAILQKGIDEIERFMHREVDPASVILETHINSYFFAYNHLDSIPEDCIYIVVDRYPEMLKEYKRLLESMGVARNFLFIADNSFSFPLRKKEIDFLVNCMSDNEYSLYNTGSYIHDVKPYLKDDARIVGTLLSFDGITESQRRIHEKYPEGNTLPYSRLQISFIRAAAKQR